MQSLSTQYPLQKGVHNPILRARAQEIPCEQNFLRFAQDLLDLMWLYEWVWLAAPQVGKSWRIIATTQWKQTKKWLKLVGETVMLNPVIVAHSDEMIVWEEGCLSIPGIKGSVARYQSITLSFYDFQGKKQTQSYSDFDATIIQHEIDHLDGVLFVDKLVLWGKNWLKKASK